MTFTFRTLSLSGLTRIEPHVYPDVRGVFIELYKHSDFTRAGINEHFVQENYSFSKKGVLRGLHYQSGPLAQGKLVRCLHGEIFDIAADVTQDSPTYGKWEGVTLSSDNRYQLYIPAGYAHGFCVLSDSAEVVYLCTEEYNPSIERGVRWDDPLLDITWPISNPILSDRDQRRPLLNARF